MKTLLLLIVVSTVLVGCSIDRTRLELVEKESVLLKEFQQLAPESRVRIADKGTGRSALALHHAD